MPHLGPTELIIILVIAMVIFGGGKLANLGGSLGKAVKDFRTAVREEEAGDGKGEGSDVSASTGTESEPNESS